MSGLATPAQIAQLTAEVTNLAAAVVVLQDLLAAHEVNPNLQLAISSAVLVIATLTRNVVITHSLPGPLPIALSE